MKTMHKDAYKLYLIGLFCMLITPAMAVDVALQLDANSAYVYHGLTYNDGLVLQPMLDVYTKPIGFNIWANLDLNEYGIITNSGEFTEVDLTVYYTAPVKFANISISYAEYLFPHVTLGGKALEGTREIILNVSRDLPQGFLAFFKLQYDIDEIKDYYARVGLGYGLELTGQAKLDLSGTIAHVGDDMSVNGNSGFHEYNLGLSASYTINEAFSLGANINYTDTMDKDVLPKDLADVNVYGGVSLIYTMK